MAEPARRTDSEQSRLLTIGFATFRVESQLPYALYELSNLPLDLDDAFRMPCR